MAQRRYTLAEAVRSYLGEKLQEELRGEWGAAVFFRPPSLLLTPVCLNLGIGPMAVTLASLVVVLALPWLAFWGGPQGYLYVGLAGAVIGVLDCLDGSMARVAERTGRMGHYADFLVGVLDRVLGYLAIGMVVAFEAGPGGGWFTGHAVALALAAALAAVMARLSRQFAAAWPDTDSPKRSGAHSPAARLAEAIFPVISGLDQIWPLFVLLFGALGGLHWFLAWLIFYSALDFLHTQVTVLARLR